jgi:hypothetical protein
MHDATLMFKSDMILAEVDELVTSTKSFGLSKENAISILSMASQKCSDFYDSAEVQSYFRVTPSCSQFHSTLLNRVSRILVMSTLAENLIEVVRGGNFGEITLHTEVFEEVIRATRADEEVVGVDDPLTP